MVSNGKKVIIILFIFDAIISGLLAYSPTGTQALTGWLILNLIIIFPAILIRLALNRRKRKGKREKEISGSLNYFEGAIYDPKLQSWKVPAKDSIYMKQEEQNELGNSDASHTIKHESQSPHNTATKSREERHYVDVGTLAGIKTTGSKISHLSDIGGLVAEGFSRIAQENECILLRKNLGTQADHESLVSGRETYALVIGEQLLWKESFERPLAATLSSEAKVGVIWEKALRLNRDSPTSNSSICYLSVLDRTGQKVAEFDLPFSAYAIAISGDLAIVSTAFPDNSIRCYDITNTELKWKVENITGQTITQLEVDGDTVYVYESLGAPILFTLSLEGNVESDSTGIFTTVALIENLRTALSGVAEVKFGWNEKRDFPIPMVSVMKLDGLPDQVDVNIWSHTSDDKMTTTRIVSNVLEAMKDRIIVQGMDDITNEENGVLDPVSWKVVEGSKPIFRKLIRAKIMTKPK